MRLLTFTQNLHRNMTLEAKNKALSRIIDSSKPSGSYYLLMCLSAIIAAFGLLANSAAVVIGAMLVAPLMGPIFGIALSLTSGDSRRLKIALVAEIAGIILAVGLPALIGLIPLRLDFGSEILTRTQPTVYDVLIALASGFAGAYALINEKISPALPGVAIATALVPPLAACGLNLAAGNWVLAGGAFLLFIINLFAIEFAAAIMFIFYGLIELPKFSNGSCLKTVLRRLGISFLILLLAAAFMTHTLINIVGESRLDKQIRKVLAENLTAYAGARLSDVKYSKTDSGLEIRAVVITPQEFDPTRVAALEEALQAKVNTNTQLIVSSVISKDSDHNGPVFISTDELKRRNQVNQETEFMNKVSLVLSEQIKYLSGTQISDVTKDTTDGIPLITASVRTPQAITPAEVLLIQKHLNEEVDGSIKLIVRSILTKNADSTHFLKNTTDLASTLQEEDLELYNRLLDETTVYLSSNPIIAGVTLVDLSFEKNDNLVKVFITVNTPITLEPVLVADFQNNLQKNVDPLIVLTVRSIVGGTATADNYVKSTGDDS
jgi:uncharacterized hydrophobic protein (TIGR00271 family)